MTIYGDQISPSQSQIFRSDSPQLSRWKGLTEISLEADEPIKPSPKRKLRLLLEQDFKAVIIKDNKSLARKKNNVNYNSKLPYSSKNT